MVLGASVVVTCVVPMVVDTVVVVVTCVASVVVGTVLVDEVIAAEYFKHFELDKVLTAPMPSGRSQTSPKTSRAAQSAAQCH